MKQIYPPFTSGSIRLRLLEESDLPVTLEWRNRDGARQHFKTSDVLTWAQHYQWFGRYQAKADDIVFMVEDLATRKRVGQVAIYSIDPASGRAEVGRFVVAPEFAGQGRMREAIVALMRFAANQLSLSSVYLEVFETNLRARRLYRTLGFVEQTAIDGLVIMERNIDDHI
ncbi:GNAT family N-acetyltransferase [Paraburkholderia kirstenboschensis]|uniref:GNAT family N-acetyltransferase n=1 Tax=Paraburkholderia kirstenboschensis TaxID=1245436 RepID=A0ABZ0ENA7_9BURK|nr:GNAT family N-acetyltransferase [Paraburkholderia kirstenboschensis]WOD18676.1 GNAT family N-acetyltransferase [Paraburkholderia kirstenboschensis]